MAALTLNEAEITKDLVAGLSYKDICEKHRCSRGGVYRIAVKHGARRNENRISERKLEAKARRKEFMQDVINATVKADVLDYLDGISDDSIDLWVTSPPYNVGKDYETSGGTFSLTYYVGWLLQVCSEMARTLKPTGVLCLQVGSTKLPSGAPYPIDLLVTEHLRNMGLHFQNRIIWSQPHGLTPTKRLAERHETILVFSRSAEYTFNPTPARQPQKQPSKRAYKGPNKGKLSGNPLGAFPTNVWTDIGNVGYNSPDRKACGDHPAPFPLKLAKRLILLYSNPGDIVGDPFCGTGTSCVGAVETGRAYTGADIFYEDVRAKRLQAVAPDLVSVLPGISNEVAAVWQAEAIKNEVAAEVLDIVEIENQYSIAFA